MKAAVVTPHRSNYPDPISFNTGDVVFTGLEDAEFPGWIRVTTEDGNEGWAPKTWLRERAAGEAFALRDYTARELETTRGEILIVHLEQAAWLWVENARGKSGWIPKKTVDLRGD